MHPCLLFFKIPTYVFLLFLQWLLPARLSVLPPLRLSLPQNCPLQEKTENAPFALTKRSTQLSTPADTCACATTAGSSWKDRLMPAVRYAGGLSKMLSKHIGRDGSKVQTGEVTSAVGYHLLLLLRLCCTRVHGSWSQLEISHTRT